MPRTACVIRLPWGPNSWIIQDHLWSNPMIQARRTTKNCFMPRYEWKEATCTNSLNFPTSRCVPECHLLVLPFSGFHAKDFFAGRTFVTVLGPRYVTPETDPSRGYRKALGGVVFQVVPKLFDCHPRLEVWKTSTLLLLLLSRWWFRLTSQKQISQIG